MKKKYPRLPNGFGSIRNLGKGRRHPYAVHPPATETDSKGNYIHKKALCYVDDWYVAFAVLNAYRAGTYKPGDEFDFARKKTTDAAVYDDLVRRILADYSQQKSFDVINNTPTVKAVYDELFARKFGENAPRTLSDATKRSFKAGFNHFTTIENKAVSAVNIAELQACFDDCKLKDPSIKGMYATIKQVFDYAESRGYIEKNIVKNIILPEREKAEHGVPFSDDEIHTLWTCQENPTAEMLLIMIYSGYRISAYRTLEVNLEEMYFKGGVKTASSKDRIVPIHSGIADLVKRRLARDGRLLDSPNDFRKDMIEFCKAHGMNHTSHDARHTFSALCEKYGVKEADRKRMLGHSFGGDITNGVYGHRSLDDLRAEIEKIEICDHL